MRSIGKLANGQANYYLDLAGERVCCPNPFPVSKAVSAWATRMPTAITSKQERPRCLRGLSRCAEEDSNLHLVSLDQALNIVGQAVAWCGIVL